MREIFPCPPKLGELTAFSRVRHGFGVREAVPLAVGSLSYRRVICPPRRSWVLRAVSGIYGYGVLP